MAFVNLKTKMIQVKIVYYGPGRCGKTTNLEYIHRTFHQRVHSEMVAVKTHGDRTLFFDFMPFDIELINGYRIKVQLYTVPGQARYNATRRLVLKGVDGVVFVADAIGMRRQDNLQSLKNLQENLTEYHKSLRTLPWVIQYNKMDLREHGLPVMSVAQMEHDLNRAFQRPAFPASALRGANVAATLKKIIALTVASMRNELA